MHNQYTDESARFRELFSPYRKNRIVLYGIGRFTATLLPELKDFQIIGLMDKDPDNVGTYRYGLPVMDADEVRQKADMIIINTSGTYWKLIYNRIRDIGLPIYYRDGKQASDQTEGIAVNQEFWAYDTEIIIRRLVGYEVISFDFFDTLFMRKVYLPTDVFTLVDRYMESEGFAELDYAALRYKAYTELGRNIYTLEELYETIGRLTGMDREALILLGKTELETERRILIPRRDMISIIRICLELGKEVYVISDMYLPNSFLEELLCQEGIILPEGHIWVSGEKKADKKSGMLWRQYVAEVVMGRKAIHIGDDEQADETEAALNGIDTLRVPNAAEMLRFSSIHEMESYLCSSGADILIGLALSELFNSPFALNSAKGRPVLDLYALGYCLIGPVIASYLLWIRKKMENLSGRPIFMARDGFFLKKDYELLNRCLGVNGHEPVYLIISRQIAACAAIVDKESFYEYAKLPYAGSFGEYMQDRFEIDQDVLSDDIHLSLNVPFEDEETLGCWIEPYGEMIRQYVRRVRHLYREYLYNYNIGEHDRVIDLGYYGHNQYYLAKITGEKLHGLYFIADLSLSNPCFDGHNMAACFQTQEDRKAANSNIYQRLLVLESFMTSPKGMVRSIDESGFIYDEGKENQKNFPARLKVNAGVEHYLQDLLKLFDKGMILGDSEFPLDSIAIDRWYGIMLDGMEVTEQVKETFYNDNALVHREQMKIFE